MASSSEFSITAQESINYIVDVSPYSSGPQTVIQQTNRAKIIETFGIATGDKVLEIGCGQGDASIVLANAVSRISTGSSDPRGFVTSIDPASLDYGSPLTLGEAQSRILAHPSGISQHLKFVQSSPIEHLNSIERKAYDCICLILCSWYFDGSETMDRIFRLAREKEIPKIHVAEYSLSAKGKAMNHVLATLSQACLEVRKQAETSTSNIRTIFTPKKMDLIAQKNSYFLHSSSVYSPLPNTMDGVWEVQAVLSKDFDEETERFVEEEREKMLVFANKEAMKEGLKREGWDGIDVTHNTLAKCVQTMDIWCATFKLASQ